MWPVWLVWGNPLVRRLTLYLGVALALGGAVWYVHHRGYVAGKTDGHQAGVNETVDQDQRLMERDKQAYVALLAEGKAREQQGAAREQQMADLTRQALATVGAANARLGEIARAKDAERTRVDQLPDEALFGDITAKLAIRQPRDMATAFYPTELRAIDQTVGQYPKVLAEVATLKDKITGLEQASAGFDGQLAAVHEQLAAVHEQLAAAVAWDNKLEVYYVKAYNAIPRKGSWLVRVVTFGVRGKPRKLDLPEPTDLGKLKIAAAVVKP